MSAEDSVIGEEGPSRVNIFSPAVDIEESQEALILWVDLPGVNERNLRVTVDKNILTIQARADIDERTSYQLAHREYEVGEFRRTFRISDAVSQDSVDATLQDGVLKLVLPKAEPAKPRTIPVKTAG